MKTFLTIILALLLSASAEASTYWVSKSGSDANACFNSATEPTLSTQSKLTIAAGITCLSSGDTLKIKGGTYVEGNFGDGIPAGTSWDAATKIQAVESGVIIQPSSGTRVVYHSSTRNAYIIWDGGGGVGTYWLSLDGTNTSSDCVKIDSVSPFIRFQQVDVGPCGSNGFLTGASNLEFLNNRVHGITGGGASARHCFYISGTPTGVKVNGNEIYDCADPISGTGIQFFGDTATGANEFKRNYLHDISVVVGVFMGQPISNGTVAYNILENAGYGFSSGGNDGAAVYHNTIYNTTNTGFQIGASLNQVVDNNLITGSGTGIHVLASHETGTLIKNNLVFSPTGTDIFDQDPGGVTYANNLCESGVADCAESGLAVTFLDAANHNFSVVSSSCIDQGLDIGQPFNGSAPDCGAFETIVYLSGSVEAGDANTIRTNWENNVFPPLLPASGATGFTARVNAGARTVTAVTRVGNNRFDLTIDGAAVVSTDDVDFSYSGSGTATDSALIGGTKNQNLPAKTNQAVTNNVAASTAGTSGGGKISGSGYWTVK